MIPMKSILPNIRRSDLEAALVVTFLLLFLILV